MLVLMSFKGLSVNMTQIKSVNDVAQIGFKYYPLTPKEQIRRQAKEFVKNYNEHYIGRRKRVKGLLAELKAAAADTKGSQGSEADSDSSTVTSSQSDATASQSSVASSQTSATSLESSACL